MNPSSGAASKSVLDSMPALSIVTAHDGSLNLPESTLDVYSLPYRRIYLPQRAQIMGFLEFR